MSQAAILVLFAFGTALAVLSLYDLCISTAGLRRPKPLPGPTRFRRFAILIAAHNEERVIRGIVESLELQDYPREKYDMFVVADRCSDRTAEMAREAGATVFERALGTEGGKAPALRFLLGRIASLGGCFDAVCVFDADNLASRNFLSTMNRHLDAGECCVQSYLDVKNPGDSWVTGSIAIGYWTTNRLWQAARYKLGLSAALGGTGFALDWATARRLAWCGGCLTEDLDLQMRLIREGTRVCWAHDARTYDEKPIRLAVSWRQRLRWMRGHTHVARRNLPALAWRALRRLDWVAFDAALYLLQPVRTVVAAGTLLAIASALAADLAPRPFFWVFGALLLPYLGYLAHSCLGGLPLLGLALERIPLGYWRLYPAALFFGLTWIPAAFWGSLTAHRREWTHTVHTRALALPELAVRSRHQPATTQLQASAPLRARSWAVQEAWGARPAPRRWRKRERRPLRSAPPALMLLGCLAIGVPSAGAADLEGLNLEAEAGVFFRDANREEPDWSGERLLIRLDPKERVRAQLELLGSARGGDNGQLSSLALWMDLTEHFYAFTSASVSHGADYFADRRGDAELHFKVPGYQNLVLFGGGGRAEFEDADVKMWTAGASLYFDLGAPAVLSYRFIRFNNDLETGSPRGTDGDGRTNLVSFVVGREEGRLGQLELRYREGEDFLEDFVSATGANARFHSHGASLGWRRLWTERIGTHLGFEWEKRRALFHRKGVEFRLIWHF